MAFYYSVSFLSCIIVLAILPMNAQIVTSPCTTTMLTSFTPCLNFLANGNGTAAASVACCNALRTMMGNGSACLCVIATGGIPFQIPINPNTTMSLPRACNMARVPLQCKASTPPAAAPGPSGIEAPSASTTLAPSPSPSPKGITFNSITKIEINREHRKQRNVQALFFGEGDRKNLPLMESSPPMESVY
ncbi:non-specific lipid transfer protein GPI-anchored 20-like [Solanum dulcamara]|uniref:non-specific lipid transfer protein GPI-anchored 20-like n=1 Tax=Solanum dulcamara TaxID=45834 RepID=UPI002484F42A|nr:non-specific lipid transfer protein GPI-anchored 20-like [Solanum dulcamara]